MCSANNYFVMAFYNFSVFFWCKTLTVERILQVLKNRALRRICGPKKEEVRGECRRLDKEKLNDLRSQTNTIPVMKSRRMRWTELVARVEER
jgi:hypothetical protein